MIVWKNIRFSCEACNKGHRSTKCTHINRSLLEIKSKGRPQSQCGFCRAKRTEGTGHSHHRCKCGQEPMKEFINVFKVAFDNGLLLQFPQRAGLDLQQIRDEIEQKKSIQVRVSKGKDLSESDVFYTLIPLSLTEHREETAIPLDTIFNNPCRCHYDGNCICSDLPQSRKKEPKNPLPLFAEAVTALDSLVHEKKSIPISSLLNPSSPQKCSCCGSEERTSPPSIAPNSCCGNVIGCCSGGCLCAQSARGCECSNS